MSSEEKSETQNSISAENVKGAEKSEEESKDPLKQGRFWTFPLACLIVVIICAAIMGRTPGLLGGFVLVVPVVLVKLLIDAMLPPKR